MKGYKAVTVLFSDILQTREQFILPSLCRDRWITWQCSHSRVAVVGDTPVLVLMCAARCCTVDLGPVRTGYPSKQHVESNKSIDFYRFSNKSKKIERVQLSATSQTTQQQGAVDLLNVTSRELEAI